MKKIIVSTLVASLLLTGVNAKETAKKDASVKEVNKIALSNAKEDAQAHQVKLVQEALNSLKDAHEAFLALEKKDEALATKKLESALGKLEVILASKKVPELLPIDSIIHINEYIGTSKDIEKTLEEVSSLLSNHRVQEARALMLPLQSEMDITTVSLPLGSYPDALKLAATYVHTHDMDKAKEVLAIALSTLTSVTEIVPIPLVKATDLIEASMVIAKEDKQRALAYLDAASESLKIAHYLGYVSKSTTTYKLMQEQIEAVQKEIKGPNDAQKLFETLKASLKEFKEKVFSEISSNDKK